MMFFVRVIFDIMKIKQYDRQGVVAWSNSKSHSELLASASFQEDDGLYHLDILSLDLQERSKNLNVIGNGYSDSAFRCVAWDNFGEKDSFPHGLIFTGMENSSYKLWNPAQMIATYNNRPAPSLDSLEWQEQEGIVIYEQEFENAFPVMCGEWNSLNNHMLAIGTTDVFIMLADKDPTNPDLRKPGKKNPHAGSYVTSVSWNREVGHILASASENGLVALWDVKSNNSIFHFGGDTGGSGNRNVVICWSKSISTQIAVTLDDQKSNKLQIWDLRNQKGPVIVIDKCHSKGINAMDWCETDSELILTASRDRKVVCWNYSQEEDEPLSQAVLESQPLSVKWSRKLPSIYSVSTETGTEVYSLSDANLFSYVPKWFKVPVGSTFYGSHAVLTYAEQRGNTLQENTLPDYGKNSPIRPQLKALSKITEQRIEEEEGELARLIRAKISQGDSEVYEYLGFNKAKIVEQAEKYTGKKREFATAQQQKEKSTKQKPKAYTQIQGQDALAFFANIKAQEQPQNRNQQQEGAENYDMVPRNFNWDQGKERLVKQNILIGNYDGAIDAALKCGRTAEALIIAFSVGPTLFSNTLKTFFTETTDNFITDVLKHIAYKDAEELVKRYDLKKWKECIALIFTLASKDKRATLLGQLAHRLRTESPESEAQLKLIPIPEDHPAIICHVLAEDFAKITQIYFDNLRSLESGSLQRKQTVVEYARRLLMVYNSLTTEVEVKLFQSIVREVAFIAIEERENVLAHHLLSTFANGNAMKHLDYLISNTPALDTYKTAIKYKPIVLPVMQKKAEKKQPQQNQQKSAPENKQKPKTKIFDKEEEVVKPPPVAPKRKEEPQEGGFSPYENTKPVEAPPKKNLNTPPPPPPVVHKKPVHHEEEDEREAPPPPPPPKVQPVQPLPTPKKNNPPPPPPPPAHHQQEEEPVHKPPVKASPGGTEKKGPPPPPVHKQPPPPPPVHKQESTTEIEQEQPKTRPPPPPAKLTPPPPPRPQEPQVKEEPPRKQPPSIKPPPKVEEKPKPSFQPAKQEQPREQAYEQPPEPVKRTPPPPPVKRSAPPPPPRK